MILAVARMGALGGLIALLSACTVFPEPEPPRVMDLLPAPELPPMALPEALALRVDTPLATDPVSDSRVLLKPSEIEYLAFPNARWRETAPVLVRDYLVETLRKSGGFVSVVSDTSAATTDVTLISELTAFHVERRNDGLLARIELYSELQGNRSHTRECVHTAEVEVPSADDSLEGAVTALGVAVRALSSEIRDWLSRCLGQS